MVAEGRSFVVVDLKSVRYVDVESGTRLQYMIRFVT